MAARMRPEYLTYMYAHVCKCTELAAAQLAPEEPFKCHMPPCRAVR
jgi:hypothetical protein